MDFIDILLYIFRIHRNWGWEIWAGVHENFLNPNFSLVPGNLPFYDPDI